MALLSFNDDMHTPSTPKTPALGLSGSAALLEAAGGAAVGAAAMLPSRGELPAGALPRPSPVIVTGLDLHSQRQVVA